MDSFEGHKTDIVNHKCAINNIHKIIISEGLTSIIQPLDMNLEACDDISAEMIIKLFKKYGISNELNGTENDLLYSSDKENSEVDNNENLLEIIEEDI
ncbi:16651_t:CDS:2, partial [Gigaspora margarita]